MAEEENKQQQQQALTADEYAEAIKTLKANSVDKKEFEKLQEEKSILVKALAGEGPVPDSVQKQAQKKDLETLRKEYREITKTNPNNAEYIKLVLELRQAEIDAGELDPFLPAGAKVNPTPSDIAKANEVADKMQSWLDAATDESGKIDPELFNAFKNKGIAEDNPIITARLKAAEKARKK